MIFIILPHILLAGWVKEGNGYISQDSLPGQKRFLPTENAVIVENKDFVLKYDLTTGEIIKRIDIVETDTTYKMAVANDDLSQVYKLYELLTFSNSIYTVKNHNSNEVIYQNFGRAVSPQSYTIRITIESGLYYAKNNLILSVERINEEYIGYYKDQFLKVIPISSPIDTNQVIGINYKFNGYMDYSAYSNSLIFRQNLREEKTYGSKHYNYYNSLGLIYLNEMRFINFKNNTDVSGKYGNANFGKLTNPIVYETSAGTFINSKLSFRLSNIPNERFSSFTRNDEMILSVNSNKNSINSNSFIQLTSLLDRIILKDTIQHKLFDIILFDDGQTFYFNSNDRLFKYIPTYLSEDNLHASMGEISDTLNVSAQFSIENQSSGLPNIISWYIDNRLISNEQILTTSIAESGIHEIKLVVANKLSSDSIFKKVFVLDNSYLNKKKIDFDMRQISSTPIAAEFNATDSNSFKKFIWNMGDGAVLYGNRVKYKYLDSGIYSVTLTGIREDGTHAQEIKNEVMSSEVIEIDYTKPIFEKFYFRDLYRLYFKPINTMKKIRITVKDKFESILYENYYQILSKGEIISIIRPVDNKYKIIVELENGVMYEY